MENTNKCTVVGTITDMNFSHETHGEKIYKITVAIQRLSGTYDNIQVTVSERATHFTECKVGEKVKISGSFRSHNYVDEKNKSRLDLYVFAETIEKCELEDDNYLEVIGYICKSPIFRKTPLGRKITDLHVAVNRFCGRSDYIPCVLWGRNAEYSKQFEVGTKIKMKGRIQSRIYQKKIDEQMSEYRIAYEFSATYVEVMDDGNED